MEQTRTETEENLKALPNDFPGNEFGPSQVLKVFHEDLNKGECSIRRSHTQAGTFVLTLHTSNRQLFTVEGPNGLLIGIGNVLTVEPYVKYLLTLPDEVIKMLHDCFKELTFTESPLLFAVNNTFRLLPKGDGTSCLYFPDNSYFLISDNIYDVMPVKVLKQNDAYWGYKISHWVRKQLHRYGITDRKEK